MQELGRLEDLPQDYRDELKELNLVPLWPSLRAVLPPQVPTRQTKPTHWPYQTIKPLLLKAGELTPIEKAERRVLVLANPGHGLEKMQASAAQMDALLLQVKACTTRGHDIHIKVGRGFVKREGSVLHCYN